MDGEGGDTRGSGRALWLCLRSTDIPLLEAGSAVEWQHQLCKIGRELFLNGNEGARVKEGRLQGGKVRAHLVQRLANCAVLSRSVISNSLQPHGL